MVVHETEEEGGGGLIKLNKLCKCRVGILYRKFWYNFIYSRHYVFCLYHVNIYLNDSDDVTFYCKEGKNIAGKLYARDSSELCHKTDSPHVRCCFEAEFEEINSL